jgi:hypothetical protein
MDHGHEFIGRVQRPPTTIAMMRKTTGLILLVICTIHIVPSPGSCFLAVPIQQHQHRQYQYASATMTTALSVSVSSDSDGGESEEKPSRRQVTGGRRIASDRPRRPPPSSSTTRTRDRTRVTKETTTAATTERRRAPHQFDHTKADARPFLNIDAGTYTKTQNPNEDAPAYVFSCDNNDDDTADQNTAKLIPPGTHIQSTSLDNLFPNLDFSFHFNSNSTFRNALRNAIREDIFDRTPSYAHMSEKARRMLLLPDSSLQGSWNCNNEAITDTIDVENGNERREKEKLRMKQLTQVLAAHLGPNAPTGDAFMTTIGNLCGSHPSTHWIDIVGIMDRKISYSWHQDTGRSHQGSDSTRRTVLLGFPREDNYDGTGVFSHAVKLKYERNAPMDHPINEPIVYPNLVVEDEFVVKPRYAMGHELIMFRDVDILHTAPEVAYRASVMRFM